ncbi:hypothetical protein KM1_280610 [Entamoeba histolytica HM-3:IMSS]|uniref:Suppressor of forked domain-containing protein n=5 Tax=Entamoeba histolytica TaxID=5759 RepID=C4M739_ENTH1|nr:hypothetical protein EHI_183420 [Entamoeba histolytica HM-1:IMSS]EMD44368.1 Hypothetical protein EHI5A_220440 [Entamoeba histolytica KU27]EMS13036.1 hypothetical protein KM1_280610 [Entamoeba histolytica HM-3:IMSS]ENY65110.1 hypothetical protein EHI7A_183580 [Entamoeba histolytica HM-1:IMSS-A]GAT97313.1 hypothetical protein CL6EHI_183420 [Entamoeba histolytica]EAL48948.1 hypothetical protein EHI_183420 [Entamoeba histolytica HM-1:IMSS]|eukprot:XP_654334.1 hypothetical protein EHI_183420 [Entamoeba histolytica HM-1:IMSS]
MEEEQQESYETQYLNGWSEKEMELINNLKSVYQSAITKFPQNEELIRRYNTFLQGINDQTNERALLNLALSLMPEKKEFVWKLYHEFEEKCGTTESLMEFEERYMADTTMDQTSNQHSKFTFIWIKDLFTYLDKKPFSEEDDMDYGSMKEYFEKASKFEINNQRNKTKAGDENEKLTQLIQLLPLNYHGKIIDVDKLIEVLSEESNDFI